MGANTNRLGQFLIVLATFLLVTVVGYLIIYFQPSLVPLLPAVLGLVAVLSGPLWQRFVNAPNLSIEIVEIKRDISEDAKGTRIQLEKFPELMQLNSLVFAFGYLPSYSPSPLGFISSKKPSVTLQDLEQLIVSANQLKEDFPQLIKDHKQDFDKVKELTSDNFTEEEYYRLDQRNAQYNQYLGQLSQSFIPPFPTFLTPINTQQDSPEMKLKRLKKGYQKSSDDLNNISVNLQNQLSSALQIIERLRDEITNKHSVFFVSVSIINSGQNNTAIKAPALLRVLISEGNYIDLRLTLKESSETKSVIPGNGTSIVIFESKEMSSLQEEDQKLIDTYWGQAVNARLLLEDIQSKVYISNRIAFAEGIYQKIIYDRLARRASDEHFQ